VVNDSPMGFWVLSFIDWVSSELGVIWDFWWEEVEAEGEAKSYQAKTIQVKDWGSLWEMIGYQGSFCF